MKPLSFIILFFLSLNISAQKQALYYFDKELKEFTGKFPPLNVMGGKGKFEEEVVEKFGKTSRKVYRFPLNSGLIFDNTKIQNFITGSYGIEMYFKYDDGSMLLYNQIMGDDLANKQGKYVHLVTTRNQITKKVNIFIDGKIRFDFADSDNQMEMDKNAQVTFFADSGRTTTSGTVAMIKLYDFFIDTPTAQNLFKAFTESADENSNSPLGVLKNLYFLQSLPILLPESTPELEKIDNFLSQNPALKIELQGHTDNQGDFDLNLKLSKDRAETIKKYLVERGISQNRIKTKGFGSTLPIASNANELTRSKNRRVELVVEK
ncbi:MAG: OmpA family protein [Emticicia sp.]|nr:OmpA family protein [Emticicia sp.]